MSICSMIVLGGLAVALSGGLVLAMDNKPFSGKASFYGFNHKGKTASGEPYDPHKYTAAHRTLPFGTAVRVTDPHTKRSVTVVINDRGPFIKGRVIDLSLAAAQSLGMTKRGVVPIVAAVE